MIAFHSLLATYNNYPLFKDDGACNEILDLFRGMKDARQMMLIGFVVVPDWVQFLFRPLGAHNAETLTFMMMEEADVILKRYHSLHDLAYLPNALRESLKVNPNWAIFDVPFNILEIEDNKHLQNTLDSMHQLPVKMGLCSDPHSYAFSSASHPELLSI